MMFYQATHVASQSALRGEASDQAVTFRTLFNEARAMLREARARRTPSAGTAHLPVEDGTSCA